MTNTNNSTLNIPELLKQIQKLRSSLSTFKYSKITDTTVDREIKRFVAESGSLITDLQQIREQISPIHFGTIGITLGRSDSIAKFFAFSFNNQEKRALDKLIASPFYGAGVYAIYYHGKTEKAYLPLSRTETRFTLAKPIPKTLKRKLLKSRDRLFTPVLRNM